MTLSYPEFPTRTSTPVASIAGGSAVWQPTREHGAYKRVFKRAFDVSAVLVTAPVWVPLVILLALLIARDGGSPFYTQDRVGLGRKTFRIWKLRSMVVDADARLEAYLTRHPEARREWDETQKLKSDPRITRLGRLLRKCSLDELPQLWNVLVGDMSLVGPRPMMTSQMPLYPGQAYYSLRPGVTGYWQISARNDSSFAARAVFDEDYERDLSLGTDLKVLAGTVRVVLHCTGH